MTTPLTQTSLRIHGDADFARANTTGDTASKAVSAPRPRPSHGPIGRPRKKRIPPDHRRIGAPLPRWKTGRRPCRDARMGYPARRRDGDWMSLRRVKDRPRPHVPRSRREDDPSRGDPRGEGLASDAGADDGGADDDASASGRGGAQTQARARTPQGLRSPRVGPMCVSPSSRGRLHRGLGKTAALIRPARDRGHGSRIAPGSGRHGRGAWRLRAKEGRGRASLRRPPK